MTNVLDNNLQSTLRKIYLRLGLSIASFVAFCGFIVNALLVDGAGLGWGAIFPLAFAVIVLPRHRRSGNLDTIDNPSALDREAAARIGRLGTFSTVLRGVYLLLVIVGFALVRYVGG